MKFEHTDVHGFEHALRGMRNPKESWAKGDSRYVCKQSGVEYIIGPNDMKLAQTLIKSGGCHRKFIRQIMVWVDITAPLYWWKEFDTYKVGTTSNSTSTMHKLSSTPITEECFEMDDCDENLVLDDDSVFSVKDLYGWIIYRLERLRQRFLLTKNKRLWKELIRWLPSSWLQKRTVTMSYENLYAMCSKDQRRFHKLNEWSGIDNPACENFIDWARSLPYAKEFIFIDEVEE